MAIDFKRLNEEQRENPADREIAAPFEKQIR
jgi:hypothetical protein